MMDQGQLDAKYKAVSDACIAWGAAMADEFSRISEAILTMWAAFAAHYMRRNPRYNQRALLVMKRRLSAAMRIRRVRVQRRAP